MKFAQSLSLVAVGVAAAFAVAPAMAQQPAPSKPVAQIKDAEARLEAIKITAIVTAIDAKNRIVTLQGPEGSEFAVQADPAVKNFGQVKVGDKLVVEYIQAVALDFQKGDGIRMMSSIDDSARAKAGQRPGAAALRKVTVVTNIWAVNQAKGTVLVRGPFGHFTEVKLKDPGLLGGVKVGDQMKVTYTDTVAIGFTPAK
jgi:hypothetical protein